eukprot:COSAG06_NODE_474_length_15284_cov_124.295582_3_plen_171_part_00
MTDNTCISASESSRLFLCLLGLASQAKRRHPPPHSLNSRYSALLCAICYMLRAICYMLAAGTLRCSRHTCPAPHTKTSPPSPKTRFAVLTPTETSLPFSAFCFCVCPKTVLANLSSIFVPRLSWQIFAFFPVFPRFFPFFPVFSRFSPFFPVFPRFFEFENGSRKTFPHP